MLFEFIFNVLFTSTPFLSISKSLVGINIIFHFLSILQDTLRNSVSRVLATRLPINSSSAPHLFFDYSYFTDLNCYSAHSLWIDQWIQLHSAVWFAIRHLVHAIR